MAPGEISGQALNPDGNLPMSENVTVYLNSAIVYSANKMVEETKTTLMDAALDSVRILSIARISGFQSAKILSTNKRNLFPAPFHHR